MKEKTMNQVEICTGTACYVLGAAELLELEDRLSQEDRKTVELRAMGCQNLCREHDSRPPFIRFNGQVMGQMTLEKLTKLLELEVQP